ncbi:hypothetical protein [Blastopirellula retiformator]|nr:hypothetical protein [Blastopirellula retiformator]
MISQGAVMEMAGESYEVILEDCPVYDPASADNSIRVGHEYVLQASAAYRPRSFHVVRVLRNDEEIASCILIAGGGASAIHDNSAVPVEDVLYIAVGDQLAALSLPTLKLTWSAQADNATCFGVFYCEQRDCLITHGELTIARFSRAGKVEWQTGGPDIFTGQCKLEEDAVRVVDFNGDVYRLRLDDGQCLPAN